MTKEEVLTKINNLLIENNMTLKIEQNIAIIEKPVEVAEVVKVEEVKE